MKIIVDKSKCSSIGLCEATAADIFEIGADGALHILMDDISEDRGSILSRPVRTAPPRR